VNIETLKTAWGLLSSRERRIWFAVLAISLLAAVAQVAMVGSVMPFLEFISDPSAASENKFIARLKQATGFDNYKLALLLGFGSIAVILTSNLVLAVRSYAMSRFAVMRIHTISSRLLRSYMGRPYEYFLNRNSGDISKRILSETGEISSAFLQPLSELIASAMSALMILALLTYLQPVGTLVGFGLVLIIYLSIYRVAGRFLARLGQIRAEQNKHRFQTVGEIFGGIKDIKIHDKEEVYFDRFEVASRQMLQTMWKSKATSDLPQFLIQAFFLSGVIGACLFMISPAQINGTGSIAGMIPTLGVFAFAGQRIVPEVQRIYAAISKISYGAAAIRSVSQDMDSNKRVPQDSHPRIEFSDSIVFRNVAYAYPGSDNGIDNLTTTIPKGSRVGLVGGTGAGKTTLVDLLLGLLEPSKGAVEVDGVALDERAKRAAWRKNIGYVPQQIFLLDATIAQNIAFGIPEAEIDMEKVLASARAARIHDFIMTQTTEQYQTVIGERGVMLSGGQRQRIGIARALYQDASLIVMDEATSALDSRTEKEVMQAIDDLPRDITLVLIAHRLGTLRNCDKLLVMERGQIIEEGSWAELAEADGPFSRQLETYQP
jgi:ABC-type multidrug transport system fused ATPase/permease subunit